MFCVGCYFICFGYSFIIHEKWFSDICSFIYLWKCLGTGQHMFSDGTSKSVKENVCQDQSDSYNSSAGDVCSDISLCVCTEKWCTPGNIMLCFTIFGFDMVLIVLHTLCQGCCEKMFFCLFRLDINCIQINDQGHRNNTFLSKCLSY